MSTLFAIFQEGERDYYIFLFISCSGRVRLNSLYTFASLTTTHPSTSNGCRSETSNNYKGIQSVCRLLHFCQLFPMLHPSCPCVLLASLVPCCGWHLALIDRVFRTADFLCGGSVIMWILTPSCRQSSLHAAQNQSNASHPLDTSVPSLSVSSRPTRRSLAQHSLPLPPGRCRASQFQRCCFPRIVRVWNSLPLELMKSRER